MTASFTETIQTFSAPDYWQALLATGWVNYLPSGEQAQLGQRLETHFARYPQQAWTVLAPVVFDSEGFYAAEDYAALLAEFAAGSFGRFTPTRVTAVEGDDFFTISFSVGQQTYEATLSTTSDYFDEQLVSRINQALADQGTAQQFILLPAFDQVHHYAFTTPQAIQTAKERQLIPESDIQLPASFTFTPAAREFTLTKAQFALLMARVFGDPFLLDAAALQDLELDETAVAAAKQELIAAGHLDAEGNALLPLANYLAASMTPSWKCVVQLRSQETDWVQIAVHFSEGLIVAEALNQSEERLFSQFSGVADLLTWLLNSLPSTAEDAASASATTLETLLPQAHTVATFLVIDAADEEDDTKATAVWLYTDSGLWFVDDQVDAETASQLTKTALHDRLYELLTSTIPLQPIGSR